MTAIGSTSSATYRADGLRASKTTSSGTTYYLYDGAEPIIEMNSSGTVTALNVFAPDGLCARQVGSATTEYVFDQQGNVADRTDTSGTTQSITQYDAWGAEQIISGTDTDPFGYNAQSGYYLDRETGLYLCQHRLYDPANGRWLNRDPIGYGGGTNLYGYCAEGPMNAADSSGEIIPIIIGIGIGALALGGVIAGLYGTWADAQGAQIDKDVDRQLEKLRRSKEDYDCDADAAAQRDQMQGAVRAAGSAWKAGESLTYDNPLVNPSGSTTISPGGDAGIVDAGEDFSDALDKAQQAAKIASDQRDEWRERQTKEREKRSEGGKVRAITDMFHWSPARP